LDDFSAYQDAKGTLNLPGSRGEKEGWIGCSLAFDISDHFFAYLKPIIKNGHAAQSSKENLYSRPYRNC
jgi:hypothetical protein